MRLGVALLVLLLLRAAPAAADLYRWIDPESGSVKYSSYPPPWYGDAAAQRRAPKVEVIPAAGDGTPRPGGADKAQEAAKAQESLEAQRKAMLQQIAAIATLPGGERGGPAMQKQLEAYAALVEKLDKLSPEGAAARRGEVQMLLEKIGKGEPR